MDNQTRWYINQRLILHRPISAGSLEIIKSNNNEIVMLLERGLPPVHLLVDVRHLTSPPIGILELSRATTLLNHPALGWVITLATDPTIRFLAGLLPQLAGREHYRIFVRFDAALAFLKEIEPGWDWSNAGQSFDDEIT